MSCRAHCPCFISLLLFGSFVTPLLIALILSSLKALGHTPLLLPPQSPGTHHAYRSHGSGFCILNDLAVTAEVLLSEGKVERVLILDLDVHQV